MTIYKSVTEVKCLLIPRADASKASAQDPMALASISVGTKLGLYTLESRNAHSARETLLLPLFRSAYDTP